MLMDDITDVRFGSLADILGRPTLVPLLHLKADVPSAGRNVR